MPAKLTVVAGPHAGLIFPLANRDTFLVGRTPDCHFRLADDPYLSDRHFLVELNVHRCRVTDLGSRNGTRLNGRKVPTADLANGKSYVLREAWCRAAFELNTREGQTRVRFEGTACDEINP